MDSMDAEASRQARSAVVFRFTSPDFSHLSGLGDPVAETSVVRDRGDASCHDMSQQHSQGNGQFQKREAAEVVSKGTPKATSGSPSERADSPKAADLTMILSKSQ